MKYISIKLCFFFSNFRYLFLTLLCFCCCNWAFSSLLISLGVLIMPSTVCRGSSGISSSPSVALAFSKLLEASHRDIPCQALAWPGVCAVRLHCARLHTGVGVILPAGDSKGASCLRRASPQSGAGGFEHTRPLCSPFPPPLQPSPELLRTVCIFLIPHILRTIGNMNTM